MESITLNDTVHAGRNVITDYNHNGIPDLNAKFDRQALAAVIETGNAVVITVNGMVGDIAFTGTDTIRVIGKKQKTAEDDYESDEDEEDDGEDEDNTVTGSDAGGDTASSIEHNLTCTENITFLLF